ncbi:acyl carrier protein [Yimella lutea]|uniref:Acyl carrier protein n=2 Tax=Yimella lutea TaxID=587872 RepID=A0A542EGM8_9MICO|nr:acyl carrier protein [Yimella lutea]
MTTSTPANSTPSAQEIVECIKAVTNRDVTPDTDIFDSAGVDSLSILRCRANLKTKFGFPVPASAFFNGRTPTGIAQRIEEIRENG